MSDARSFDGTAVQVNVNGQAQALPERMSVAELLALLGHKSASVAVAVNGEFVPRAGHADRLLRDGDQVACFKPIVGG
jgi:sulfur carrier protein